MNFKKVDPELKIEYAELLLQFEGIQNRIVELKQIIISQGNKKEPENGDSTD